MEKISPSEYIDSLLREGTFGYCLNHTSLPPKKFIREGCLIANALSSGVDELVLIKELLQLSVPFKIFSTRSFHFDDPILKEFYHTPYHLHFQSLTFPPSLKAIRKALKNMLEAQLLCVIILDFHPKNLEAIRQRKLNRSILREVKKLHTPLTPVFLKVQNKESDTASLILRWGKPITPEEQVLFKKSKRFYRYVQARIHALGSALEVTPFFQEASQEGYQEAIALPEDSSLIEQDIQSLYESNLVLSRAQFDLFVAQPRQIPNVLREIGRLREIAFRDVGEGSGKARDIDEFDLYYHQLIIWDREQKKIAGGYRIGKGDEIFNQFGVEGLYIFTLFKIKSGLYPTIRKSIELGRSYVTVEYQKQRLPLFLLWKGILHFILQNPHYEYLYGPLSISTYYSDISKSLMVRFFTRHYFDKDLARFLKPRNPYKLKTTKEDIDVLLESMGREVSRLDSFIEEVEPSNFRMPVLLKQYVRQNARFLAFNIDPQFSDVLDGFIILNLKDLPESTIKALQDEP